MDRKARRVLARWGFWQASQGWQPSIPVELLDKYQVRTALALTQLEQEMFQSAKESVYGLLPAFIQLLRKRMGSRYGMSASQRAGNVFLYFTEPTPVDSWTIHLSVNRGRVLIDVGYMPMRVGTDRPDLAKAEEVTGRALDPDLAGLVLMRLTKQLLDRVA